MSIAVARRSNSLRNADLNTRFFDLELDLWRESAACIGKPHSWFEKPDEVTATNEQVAELNENITNGVEVCSTCPVVAQCLKDASPADMAHTVRGGQWPTSISKKARGRPRKDANAPRKFAPRKRDLTPDEVRLGKLYLSNHDRCEGADSHVVLELEHLTFKRNGIYIKARCRACVQDDNLEHKRRSRGKIEA